MKRFTSSARRIWSRLWIESTAGSIIGNADKAQAEDDSSESKENFKQESSIAKSKNNSSISERIQNSNSILKPKPKLCGLKRTAQLMSSFFGADQAKSKFNSQLEKHYLQIQNYIMPPPSEESEN
jgi:hypothetical protein